VAFNEPGLMGEDVWFGVSSYGYELSHESFGFQGVALKVTPGGCRSRSAESIARMRGIELPHSRRKAAGEAAWKVVGGRILPLGPVARGR
jgi:hypothetical protein